MTAGTALAALCVAPIVGLIAGLSLNVARPRAETAQLAGPQITEKLAGKSHLYCGPTQGWLVMNADGTARMEDSKFGKSTGRWWVKDNQMCRMWQLWPKQSFCTELTQLRGDVYRTGDGFVVYSFEQVTPTMTCATAAKS